MTRNKTSTRRMFLKGGALLAAPIAAASVSAMALADDELQRRVRHLEDQAAIRQLHDSWLRQVNAGEHIAPLQGAQPDGAVRRITAHNAGAPDKIDIAADGRSAVGYFDTAIERETALPRDSTLAQMAYLQGNGAVRSTGRAMLKVHYVKTNGMWNIGKVELKAQ